jgi:hypothetical protein
VDGLGRIILGEGLGLAPVAGSTLAGQESKGTVARPLKLTVRLWRWTRCQRKTRLVPGTLNELGLPCHQRTRN